MKSVVIAKKFQSICTSAFIAVFVNAVNSNLLTDYQFLSHVIVAEMLDRNAYTHVYQERN